MLLYNGNFAELFGKALEENANTDCRFLHEFSLFYRQRKLGSLIGGRSYDVDSSFKRAPVEKYTHFVYAVVK